MHIVMAEALKILTRSGPPQAQPEGVAHRPTVVVAVLACGLSLLVLLEGPRAWGPFVRLLLPVLVLSLAGTFAACLVVSERMADRLSGYPVLCGLGGLVGGLMGLGTNALLRGRPLDQFAARPIAWHLAAGGFVTGVLIGTTLWWLERLRRHERERTRQLYEYQVELLRAQADAAEAEAARARAALQLLQAQVEPHFIYNALANLRYLVRHDAELAQRLIEQLVRYFRVALPSLRQTEVSLAQELELCSAYGAIQAMRLGGRLHLDIDVAPDLRDASLPPAVLLTLLENAFKHGVPQDGEEARITITAQRMGDDLHVSVTDNGPGIGSSMDGGKPSSGMGLKWLVERLRVVHGPRASVGLSRVPSGGCCATMVIPMCQRGAE
ncbi:MAG TPA: histidine kinase [Aquabacterium sp.]|nr:histidine kinase [Aquabacterium sp.]